MTINFGSMTDKDLVLFIQSANEEIENRKKDKAKDLLTRFEVLFLELQESANTNSIYIYDDLIDIKEIINGIKYELGL